MEILQTSLAQWGSASPIVMTTHICRDLEKHMATLRQSAAIKDAPTVENIEDYYSTIPLLHTHLDFVEISYVRSGTGVGVVNNTKRILRKGDLIFTKLGDQHANYPLSSLVILNCSVSTALFKKTALLCQNVFKEDGEIDLPTFNSLQGDAILQVEALFKSMLKEYGAKEAGYQEMLLCHLNELLIHLCRAKKPKPNKTPKCMSALLDYIATHYQDVSLTDLSQQSAYSPAYLSRLFHEIMGITFTEYVNHLRVDEAIRLIVQSDYSIEEICHMVGFNSKLHFYDVFKKHTGITPGALRK